MKTVELTITMRVVYRNSVYEDLPDALNDIEYAIRQGLDNESCCSDYEFCFHNQNITEDDEGDEDDDYDDYYYHHDDDDEDEEEE